MEEKVIVQEKIVLPKPRKSPVLAFLLSFFFPFGVGPFYNGEVIKGFIYLIIFAGLVTMQQHGDAQPFAGIVLGAFYIFQIIDSVNTANKINRRALLGGGVEEEEEAVLTPEAVTAGSVFWGVLLIVLGGILLLGNFDVISYATILDFWPVVVIVIGARLIFDYVSKKD
jgi:TM2 domain-containing membrane protein YozV